MKTELWVSYEVGIHSLVYKKTIDLPFVPFKGMVLTDYVKNAEGEDEEFDIEFDESERKYMSISYDLKHYKFVVNLRLMCSFMKMVDFEYFTEGHKTWEAVHSQGQYQAFKNFVEQP